MKQPGVVRECQHPGKPHSHGRECYRFDRCRCPAGRADGAAEEAERRKLKALGLPYAKVIDVLGSKRRIEALMTLGYTAGQMGKESGLPRYAIHSIVETNRSIHWSKAAKIAEMYDRLWDKPAPVTRQSSYVSNLARKRGYLPPLAWDEETIDDVNAMPSLLALNPEDLPYSLRVQLAGQLVDLGYSKAEACLRARIDTKTLRRSEKKEAA